VRESESLPLSFLALVGFVLDLSGGCVSCSSQLSIRLRPACLLRTSETVENACFLFLPLFFSSLPVFLFFFFLCLESLPRKREEEKRISKRKKRSRR
jgi:hypothetical protein